MIPLPALPSAADRQIPSLARPNQGGTWELHPYTTDCAPAPLFRPMAVHMNDSEPIRVEVTTEHADRAAHAYWTDTDPVESVCGAVEWTADKFEYTINSRRLDGYEDRVECKNCRRVLELDG